jgi:hypothetical protein
MMPGAVVPPNQVPKYDTATVAGWTGESQATVRRRCAAGQYPHSRFGRALRFSLNDVYEILATARRPS